MRVVKGMRDFPPEVMILRKKIFEKVEKIFQKFGFDPIETPVVEYWETLAGKYGEEAENKLIYKFYDELSKEMLALRYDLTVPLARFIALNKGIVLPFKRYHIGRVYRHENPQKGRYREFWQCDADIVGSPYPEADAEIIDLFREIMLSFGFSDFVIRLNDRRILAAIFEKGLGIKDPLPVYRIIDRLDKVGWGEVERSLRVLLPIDKVEKLKAILTTSKENFEVLWEVEQEFDAKEGAKHLQEVLEIAGEKFVRVDLSLVRGLDYYTGPIFEIFVKEPRIGALAGGGRYDKLIGLYSGIDLPATGGSLGVERLIDAGLAIGLFKLDKLTYTQVFVASIEADDYARKVAKKLRDAGFNVQIDVMRRPWRKQIEYARKKKIPVIVIVGKKEKQSKTAVVLHEKGRIEVTLDQLEEELKRFISG